LFKTIFKIAYDCLNYFRFLINRLRSFIFWGLFFFIVLSVSTVYASIVIKVSASNPSQELEQPVTVKSYLPKAIKPAHVLNRGELELGYDVKQGQYYVYKDVVLKPQEETTYEVEIEDIWVILQQELDKLREKAGVSMGETEGSEYEQMAKQLNDNIEKNLEAIIINQEANTIPNVSPIEHIGAWEINTQMVGSIKEDVASMAYLAGAAARKSEKEDVESMDSAKDGIQMIRIEDSTVDCQEGVLNVPETLKKISHNITVENSSVLEARIVPVKYFFPEEIRANDVLEMGDLELGFDFESNLYYVFNNEVSLEPSEEKVFTVVLNNKWLIDSAELISLKIHIQEIVSSVGNSKKFGFVVESGEKLAGKIFDLLSKPAPEEFNAESIVAYKEDLEEIEGIKRDIRRMENIFIL